MKSTTKLCTAAGLWIGALVVCLWATTALAQPAFVDVAPELGLNQTGSCGGVFWYDYDGDGDLDLLRTHRFFEPSMLFRNDGDHFTGLTDIGLPSDADAGTCVPMDFDHDGDYDVYIDCYSSHIRLLVNENGTYVNRTEELGITPRYGGTRPTWLDINHDGWMDLMLEFSDSWALYLNNGNNHFTDVTARSQLPNLDWGAFFIESDINLDHNIDLYTTTIGGANHLYINVGDGVFRDSTAAAGLAGIPSDFGCAWVDFDDDKYPDLLTPGTNYHSIWHNNHDGTFTEMTVHGTTTGSWGGFPYGARYAVADYDMDGDMDFYAARPGGCGDGQAANQFFRMDSLNGMDIYFTDIAPELGMDFAADGFPLWADYDRDGDLDLYLAQQDLPDRLFRNDLIHHSNRLEVNVLGPNGEKDRWHTRVEVYPHSGSTLLKVSELNYSNVARDGFNNYFVLNEDGHYDLRIYFASGAVMTPEEYPQLSDVVPSQINHLLTVYQGQLSAEPAAKPAQNFMLDAAYPNPFNASTNIRYSLPAAGYVRLAVYDVLGRHIADLVNSSVSAGEHRAMWNPVNVASGVYVVRLQAADQIAQQKVLLLK
ncbi:MAG TPA: T9SS type A sorting domain-containing protein [bacterium]|jgi:hypothetical protein